MIENEIRMLLEAPATGRDAPTLAFIEDVLTSGYARAMALEAERWRLERRIGELAGTLADDEAGSGPELRTLGAELRSTDGDLTELRGLLSSLRERAEAARAAA